MKSFFLRRMLMLTVLVVVVISSIMAVGCGLMTSRLFMDMRLDEMVPNAENICSLVKEYQRGEMTYEAFSNVVGSIVCSSKSTIVIFNQEKGIVLESNMPDNIDHESIQAALSEIYDKVLQGSVVKEYSNKITDFGVVLMAGVPIDVDGGSTVGGIVMLQRVKALEDMTRPLYTLLYTCIACGAMLMMAIMSWRMSRETDPLHKMSEVAIEMSKGNFDIRANEVEQGEVGLLARALNNLCENLSSTIYQLRSEKGQLDQLLQSLTDGVAAVDGSGVLTHYNAALMRMFGVVNVEHREDLIKDPMVWKVFDEVFHTGETQTITYPVSGDKVLWITVSPVTTDENIRTGVVGLFKDMTEMERTERMRREYVANVSHELRTPLTAVRGLLEPLADGMVKNEEDRQRYYKIMLHEVMRLSRLITDMLTLSRLQAGTEYMELSRVDMEELINDIAIGYSSTAEQKGITLEVDCQNAVDALTDADRIEQVLVILLDNAMRYTPKGGVIKLKLRSGEKLIISVEDNGCGIPEKDLPHIFERFYKVDKSRGEGGTGLGLSIAKYIMEKLDEDITVDSELGKGTRFTFTAKRYVTNAIELGPAGERQKAADHAEESHQSENSEIYDADYEIVIDPNTGKKSKRLKIPEIKMPEIKIPDIRKKKK